MGEGEYSVFMKILIFTKREVTTLSQNRFLILGEGLPKNLASAQSPHEKERLERQIKSTRSGRCVRLR
jgi:hypothetical protein